MIGLSSLNFCRVGWLLKEFIFFLGIYTGTPVHMYYCAMCFTSSTSSFSFNLLHVHVRW